MLSTEESTLRYAIFWRQQLLQDNATLTIIKNNMKMSRKL